MQRYIIQDDQINNDIITIIGNDVHHIKNVMRMRIGDEVICVINNKINIYLCEIMAITNNIILKIKKIEKHYSEINCNVTIAQGIIRKEKTEEVIRRLTELGCKKYIPIKMKRSNVKFYEEKKERWDTIIKEASEQSTRTSLMIISSVLSIDKLIEQSKEYDLKLLAHVDRKGEKLKNILSNKSFKNVLVVIGPEGGFDDTEIELLLKNDFRCVSFGNRVLRTETAPMYIMSVLGYEIGEKNED